MYVVASVSKLARSCLVVSAVCVELGLRLGFPLSVVSFRVVSDFFYCLFCFCDVFFGSGDNEDFLLVCVFSVYFYAIDHFHSFQSLSLMSYY